ncbi:MAG TPA: GAF and ANTAR domain-containing protein [Solirubrobacteraceae bacterium]|jgi:GAF domain-containing protein
MPEGHIDPAALDRSLAALRPAASDHHLMDALQQVLTSSSQMFSASGAGFMMLDDSSALCAVAATDEPGRLLEQRQEESGHGPCVDSVTFDEVTATPDLAEDDRWPEIRPEVPDAGVRAVLGVPIRASGVTVGTLNVYRDHHHVWDESETAALTSYGSVIEGLLRTAMQAREGERLAEQLQHALDNRVVIERAVGVIMGRARVDAVTAFNELRHRARSGERKVADVAAELLDEVARGS